MHLIIKTHERHPCQNCALNKKIIIENNKKYFEENLQSKIIEVKITSSTYYKCSFCNLYLCVECFYEYHFKKFPFKK